MNTMPKPHWVTLLVGTCCLIQGCGSKPSASSGVTSQPVGQPRQVTSPPQLRDVRVRLDWTPWAPHAALFAAEDQGYFRDEGLRVKLYVPPDPEATIQLVAAGQDDFGISYMTDVIMAREQGVKVVSLAAIVQHPLNCIMTLKSSGIDTPGKLKGATIGTTGEPSDQAFLNWVLENNGVNPHTVRLVNIGFNLAPALKSRKVDAIIGAYWPWEGIKLQEEGSPVNIMRLQDSGVPDYYELVLISRSDLLTKDPSLVQAFLRALVKGQQFVDKNPEQAVQILKRADPDLSEAFLRSSLQAILPLMRTDSGDFRQDSKAWSDMVMFMQKADLLKNPPDVSTAFTNHYLP